MKYKLIYIGIAIAFLVALSTVLSFSLMKGNTLYSLQRDNSRISKENGLVGTDFCASLFSTFGESTINILLQISGPVNAIRITYNNDLTIDLNSNKDAKIFLKDVLNSAPEKYDRAFSVSLLHGDIMYFENGNFLSSSQR
jgi:hypothetical protein